MKLSQMPCWGIWEPKIPMVSSSEYRKPSYAFTFFLSRFVGLQMLQLIFRYNINYFIIHHPKGRFFSRIWMATRKPFDQGLLHLICATNSWNMDKKSNFDSQKGTSWSSGVRSTCWTLFFYDETYWNKNCSGAEGIAISWWGMPPILCQSALLLSRTGTK